MSTYTGSELATKYAAYLIYKGTATPTQINQISSPKIGYVFDVTEAGTLINGNITVVAGDAVVFLSQGWTHMNNGSADQQIQELAEEIDAIQEQIGDTDFSLFALKSELPEIPTNVSDFTNDAGYLTEHQSLAAYQTKANSDAAYVGKLASLEVTATDGTIVQFIGTTTAAFKKGYFYIYQTGEGWTQINVQPGQSEAIKQVANLTTYPKTEGEIVLYTGTTTEDFVAMNFYQCVLNEWEWVDIPGITFAFDDQTKTLTLSYGGQDKSIDMAEVMASLTDDVFSNESENPLQNKVVTEAITAINATLEGMAGDLSELQIEFDGSNMQLLLLDKNNTLISSANLATLAKDAMLEDVELFTEAETGVTLTPPYLKFTFNTDAGTQPIRVELSDFTVNINIDEELSNNSQNAVENRAIKEAFDNVNERIDNLNANPDAQLSTTSIKPVQNRIITGEVNSLKDRVAALEDTGVNYSYLKQVTDLANYNGRLGEIVKKLGTHGDYINNYEYEAIRSIPAGTEIVEVTENYEFEFQDSGEIITTPKFLQTIHGTPSQTYTLLSIGVTYTPPQYTQQNAVIYVDKSNMDRYNAAWGSMYSNIGYKIEFFTKSGDTLTDSTGQTYTITSSYEEPLLTYTLIDPIPGWEDAAQMLYDRQVFTRDDYYDEFFIVYTRLVTNGFFMVFLPLRYGKHKILQNKRTIWKRVDAQPQQLALKNSEVVFTDNEQTEHTLAQKSDIPSVPTIYVESVASDERTITVPANTTDSWSPLKNNQVWQLQPTGYIITIVPIITSGYPNEAVVKTWVTAGGYYNFAFLVTNSNNYSISVTFKVAVNILHIN